MKMIELNMAELSNVNGGSLTEVKKGFIRTIKTPFKCGYDMVTLKSTDAEKGVLLGCAAIYALGLSTPWLYKKGVQLKKLILG